MFQDTASGKERVEKMQASKTGLIAVSVLPQSRILVTTLKNFQPPQPTLVYIAENVLQGHETSIKET